jgi:hypothetical protein
MNDPLCKPWEHALSRRHFLAASAGALGGLLTRGAAEQMRQREKQVLFVWLDGGISQLESWDPKPNTTFGGPFRKHRDERAGRSLFRADAAARKADAPPLRRAQPQ